MALSDTELRHLLLDMLASTPGPAPARFSGMDGGDWDILSEMAGQHRLAPLLWHRSRDAAPTWPLPENIAALWSAAYRQSAVRSLAARRLLLLADKVLRPAGIRYAALKGAYLAQYAYPHPALRPLRDVDLLIEPGRVIEAYHLFRGNGFIPVEDREVDLERELRHSKHLPALFMSGADAATGMCLELHGRIIFTVPPRVLPGSLNDVDALLQRTITIGGTPFLSPTDTLLHLMVHSMEDHEFNNGPLIINDVAQLLKSGAMDWPGFWDMADAGGWRRGCIMMLDMAARYHQLPGWPLPDREWASPSAEQVDSAALLTLQDFADSAAVSLQTDLAQAKGVFDRLAILMRRAFPPLPILSAYAGAPRTSWWSLLRYPDWLLTRARERLSNRADGTVADDVSRARQVRAWIYSGAGRASRSKDNSGG